MRTFSLGFLGALAGAAVCAILGLLFCYTPLFRMLAPVNGYDYFLAMALVYGAWIPAGLLGVITSLAMMTFPDDIRERPPFLNLLIGLAAVASSGLYFFAFFVDGDWVIWANIVTAAILGGGIANLSDRKLRPSED